MKTRKIVGVLLIVGLLVTMAMGCGGSKPDDPSGQDPSSEAPLFPDATVATATYTGRIDNNSVEMQLEGTPQAFQLSEELMETWDSLGFVEGDQLRVQYQERENDRPKLLEAKKL